MIKKFLYYFICTVIIGFIFYLGAKYQVRLEEEASMTFELMPVLLFASIYPIVIGMFLRLPKLIMEMKEKKQWTFDWIKIVAIGIPTIYIALLPILSTTGLNLLFAKELIPMGTTTLITVAGIVFGYVLLDSLKK
ncbi:hypothetical protein [Virgibacillus sp. JSM 102003]|uniref:hypothetical protein n=1 Tax=Virgibacillus sp. JSM 102003 TaxID=1562108 RepID=UPI0035BF6A5C